MPAATANPIETLYDNLNKVLDLASARERAASKDVIKVTKSKNGNYVISDKSIFNLSSVSNAFLIYATKKEKSDSTEALGNRIYILTGDKNTPVYLGGEEEHIMDIISKMEAYLKETSKPRGNLATFLNRAKWTQSAIDFDKLMKNDDKDSVRDTLRRKFPPRPREIHRKTPENPEVKAKALREEVKNSEAVMEEFISGEYMRKKQSEVKDRTAAGRNKSRKARLAQGLIDGKLIILCYSSKETKETKESKDSEEKEKEEEPTVKLEVLKDLPKTNKKKGKQIYFKVPNQAGDLFYFKVNPGRNNDGSRVVQLIKFFLDDIRASLGDQVEEDWNKYRLPTDA